MKEQYVTALMPHADHNTLDERSEIVIVGNGIAGLSAALEVSRVSPERRVTIITEQSHPTIYTPALKQFAIGKISREQLVAHPAGSEHAHRTHLMTAHVEEIHAREHFLSLRDGRTIGYHALLLATGSVPRGLPQALAGRDFDGVLALHRLKDYIDLRRRLSEVKSAVVIGGGTHAVETVMGLVERRVQVYWLIRGEICMSRVLDPEAAETVFEDCRRAGAKILTNCEVVEIVGKVGVVTGVRTSHNQLLPCQLVIACTGSQPQITLATHSDVAIKSQNGILVDEYLRTNVANIFAAGDCAAVEDPLSGRHQTHMQWHAAVLQGQMAAAMMSGQSDSIALPGVSWQATQLGSLHMVTVGDPLSTSIGVTILSDRSKKSYRRLAFFDNRLVGYLSLGNPKPDTFSIKRLIDEGHSVRGFEKDLLMGTFDGRSYFAHARTQPLALKRNTQELPIRQLLPKEQASHNTEPLLPVLPVNASDEIQVTAPLQHGEQETPVPQQKENRDVHLLLSEIMASKDSRRSVYTHFHEIARLEQSELEVFFERLAQIFGDMFPLQKFKFLLESARQQDEHLGKSTTVVRSVASLRNAASATWLIPDVLPTGLLVLADTQQVGSSWFNLALGLTLSDKAVASANSQNIQHGNVLYLALENGELQIHEQMKQLRMPGEALSDDFVYATKWARLHVGGLGALEKWLQTHQQTRLIIIDSWRKIKPLAKAGESDAMSSLEDEAMLALRYLADTYNTGIVLLARSTRTSLWKSSQQTHENADYACYIDGLFSLKQGEEATQALLSGSGRAFAGEMKQTVAFERGSWQISKELKRRRNLQKPTQAKSVRQQSALFEERVSTSYEAVAL